MFFKKAVKISLVNDEASPAPEPRTLTIPTEDIKEIMKYCGITVAGAAATIALSSAARDILVNRLSK